MDSRHPLVMNKGDRGGRTVLGAAGKSHFSFREMFFFGIGCRGGPHQRGRPAPVLDGMMRVECFSELAIGQAAQFPLPRLLQNLHDRVDQADTTAQQVEVDAQWPRIPFDVLQVMSSGEVKALGFPVAGTIIRTGTR